MKLLVKYGLTLLALSAIAVTTHAQRLQFDVGLKAGWGRNVGDGESSDASHGEFIPIQGSLHIAVSQNLAVGGFYARSASGLVHYDNSGSGSGPGYETNLETLMYGADLRLSAGRAAKWRPYLSVSFGKAEFVQEASINQPYTLAASSPLVALNAGIMLRFGRNFYWNIVEASGKYLPNRIFWLDSEMCIELKTGFLYHIRLKSK
jgi:hypothetical protein